MNLRFGAPVYVKVQLAAQAILLVLTVLAHHDDGRLDGGEHGKEQIEKDERVGIPGLAFQGNIHARVDG